MSHHDIQLISLLVSFLNLVCFVILTINQRTRMPGVIGLIGSALLLSGAIRGELFRSISNQVYLPIFGSLLLFGSVLMIFRRSRA